MSFDKTYLDLLKDIMDNGVVKGDRTGIGTKSVFGRQIRFNMNDGFPLLTTKKLHTKSIIHELLWFLNGDTNIKYLNDNGVKIWDDWGDENGDLGPVYGKQWVNLEVKDTNYDAFNKQHYTTVNKSINQVQNIVNRLKEAPDCRRMIVSAWNVAELDQMALMPCFIEGSKVNVINGEYINIEDINVGDEVLTIDGTYQRVYETFKTKYSGKLIELNVHASPHLIKSTPNHPFLVKDKGFVNSEDIIVGDYVGIPINTKNIIPEFTFTQKVNQYSNKDITFRLDKVEEWYLMGYFLGDGWLDKKGCVYLSINNKEFEAIYDKINNIVPLFKIKNSGKNVTKYNFKQDKWSFIFSKFGSGAKDKKIPKFVHDAPIEFIESFIEGYVAADGCLTQNGVSITTISDNIAFSMQLLYAKIGKKASLYYQQRPKTTLIEGRVVNQHNTYSINTYKNINKSSNYIFNGDGNLWLKVKNVKVTDDFDGFVYNISVDGNHTYTVNNIINHNCHYSFQVWTRELTKKERHEKVVNNETLWDKAKSYELKWDWEVNEDEKYDWLNIPKRSISLMWNQRSVDTLLGLPFNISSYGFLLHMIAQQVNMIPDELIANLGDAHIYSNHTKYVDELLERNPLLYTPPTLELNKANDIFSYKFDDFKIVGYKSYPNWTGKDKPPIAV